MITLLKFGSGSRVYTFPTDGQINYSDDFDKRNNKLVRPAGSNSKLSLMGSGRGQSDGGTVKAEYWLEFDDLADGSGKLDSVREMADWGLMPLWRQPLVGVPQVCWARLNSESLNQDVHNVPHLRQRLPIVFDVEDPFWHAPGTEILWGGGAKWGDASSIWGGSGGLSTITGMGTISLSDVGGNTFTHARLIIRNNSGSTVNSVTVQRKVNGHLTDEVVYTGAIPTGASLKIDPRRQSARLALVNVISNLSYRNSHWMRLEPGANELRVIASGTVEVGVRYLERYV